MQSKYVGDIGDFGKHGLLRYLSGLTDPGTDEPDLRIGLVWYLTPDQCCNRDGRHVGYLEDTPRNRRVFEACDPFLWNALKEVVDNDRRCVHRIPTIDILPQGTTFYDAPLCYPPYTNRIMREMLRERWFQGAFQATEDADIVLLDPDNGLGRDEARYRQEGPKFAYMDDLQAFWDRGQSIILYQHLGMGVPAEDFIGQKARLIRTEVGVVETFALRFRGRAFIVIPQPLHEGQLRARVGRLLRSPWGQNGNFTLVEVPHV